MNAPDKTCGLCGTKLRGFTRTVLRELADEEGRRLDDAKRAAFVAYTEACDRQPPATAQDIQRLLTIRRRLPSPHKSKGKWTLLVDTPTGHYGYQGNDLFCTMRCGFDWAVRNYRRVAA